MWSRVSPDRDDFLVLPSFDLEGWILREARYTDAAAMSRAILVRLLDDHGAPLLSVPGAEVFWTEQGDRATLISLAARVPHINAAWLDELGRWSAKMSSTYIRTHMTRVDFIQRAVADKVCESGDKLDALGEDDLLTRGAGFLCKQGFLSVRRWSRHPGWQASRGSLGVQRSRPRRRHSPPLIQVLF